MIRVAAPPKTPVDPRKARSPPCVLHTRPVISSTTGRRTGAGNIGFAAADKCGTGIRGSRSEQSVHDEFPVNCRCPAQAPVAPPQEAGAGGQKPRGCRISHHRTQLPARPARILFPRIGRYGVVDAPPAMAHRMNGRTAPRPQGPSMTATAGKEQPVTSRDAPPGRRSREPVYSLAASKRWESSYRRMLLVVDGAAAALAGVLAYVVRPGVDRAVWDRRVRGHDHHRPRHVDGRPRIRRRVRPRHLGTARTTRGTSSAGPARCWPSSRG